MYAPVTPTPLAPTLPPAAIVADEPIAPTVPIGPAAADEPAASLVPVAPAPTRLWVRRARLNVLLGGSASIAGTLLPAPRRAAIRPVAVAQAANVAGRKVVLQARGRHGWRTIAAAHTGARGRFRLRYRVVRLGSERLRVRFAGAPGERGAKRVLGRLNVYRLVEVSWYGGGGSLACGGWLTSATLGVANKTLPCGTLVTLRYEGHSVRVPVIDRGPYVAGREYDLTEATKRALGFEGVGEMWATS